MSARVIALRNRKSAYVLLYTIFMTLAIIALIMAAAASVQAATTRTQRFQDATFVSDPAVNPCTGDPAVTTLVVNGVLYLTDHPTGRQAGATHVLLKGTGDFRLVPNKPGLPSYTGQVTLATDNYVAQDNPVATFLLKMHGASADGTTREFQQLAHITVSSSGGMLSFARLDCR